MGYVLGLSSATSATYAGITTQALTLGKISSLMEAQIAVKPWKRLTQSFEPHQRWSYLRLHMQVPQAQSRQGRIKLRNLSTGSSANALSSEGCALGYTNGSVVL